MSNGEKTEEKELPEYPNIVERFREVFQKLGIKKHEGYVDHCAKGDLENLEDVERKLYEMGLHPSLRNQVINFWAAEIKQPVPKKLQKRLGEEAGRPARENAEEKPEAKYSVDTETGAIKVASTADKTALTWDEAEKLSSKVKKEIEEKRKAPKVTYVYDEVSDVVRMAKEGEVGGTLEDAKELKKMAEEGKKTGEESPFIQDPEKGWILNPKAKVTGVELMALESIRRAAAQGEPVDPLDAMAQAAAKLKTYREAFGGGAAMPEWMTDPAKFIEIVQTIGGGGKPDDSLKTEIGELRQTIQDLQKKEYERQIATQQHQIEMLGSKVDELTDHVIDLKRPVTGRTEMDLLHDIATQGLDVVKTELPGLRRDIREVLSGGKLPAPKTAEEREARKADYKKALDKDKKIEEIGRRLFS